MEKQEAAMASLPRLLRYGTVARLLAVSVSTVKRWIAEGLLETVDVGGMPRVSTEEYLRFLGTLGCHAKQGVKPGGKR
jgi:excisionase family DNA binding protein